MRASQKHPSARCRQFPGLTGRERKGCARSTIMRTDGHKTPHAQERKENRGNHSLASSFGTRQHSQAINNTEPLLNMSRHAIAAKPLCKMEGAGNNSTDLQRDHPFTKSRRAKNGTCKHQAFMKAKGHAGTLYYPQSRRSNRSRHFSSQEEQIASQMFSHALNQHPAANRRL